MALRRLVTIADFRSCGEGVIYSEKGVAYDRYLFKTANSFYQDRPARDAVSKGSRRPTRLPCGSWTVAPSSPGGGR